MATVDVRSSDGTKSGTVELDDAVFGIEPNVGAMHQVVTAQLAAARGGHSKVKTRGEVAGGGRKPYRQKGTGRARQGSTRAPHWSGGGVAHGPTGQENYSKRVSKKLKRLALRSALSDRHATGDLIVVDALDFDEPRTRDAVAVLAALEVQARRVLVVLGRADHGALRSFRNLRSVHVLTVDQLNTYDVLVSDAVVIARDALPLIGTGTRVADPAGEPEQQEVDADAQP